MELFEKVYSCYYQVVKHVLKEAAAHPLTKKEIEALVKQYGFEESALTILPKLTGGEWQLLKKTEEGTYLPVVSHVPSPPLTKLQKCWLKALLSDPRISLFLNEEEKIEAEKALAGAEPLFLQEDFYYFDRYRDGDDYTSRQYQENFRTILNAFRKNSALLIAYSGKREHADTSTYEVLPKRLEYSAKDDKFRLCCLQWSGGSFSRETVLNLGRIAACHLSKREVTEPAKEAARKRKRAKEPVVIAINGERNSLERCMLHFASYEKHTEYDEERKEYLCSIYYDLADETELLIEILSFGPVIRVLGPESFLRQVRERVKRQHQLLYDTLPLSKYTDFVYTWRDVKEQEKEPEVQ